MNVRYSMVQIDEHRIVQVGSNEDLNLVRNSVVEEGRLSERCFGSLEYNDDRIMMHRKRAKSKTPSRFPT